MKILTKDKTEVSEIDKIKQKIQSLRNLIDQSKRQSDKLQREADDILEGLKPLYMDLHEEEDKLNELKQPSLFS